MLFNGHTPLSPLGAYKGAKRPKMLLIGEAWGEREADLKKPFSGVSGQELMSMLSEALPDAEPSLMTKCLSQFRYGDAWTKPQTEWMEAVGIGATNTLNFRPPDNKLEYLCLPKADLPEKGKTYARRSLQSGKYLHPQYLSELERLRVEIDLLSPNLIVAFGNTACWGLLDATNIGSIRGAIAGSDFGVKVLPTYHPAAVLRQWSWRPIVVADLMKAWREADFPEIRRPSRKILICPTIEEVESWTAETLMNPPALLSPDIETASGQITCIGFARTRDEAIVIPFWVRNPTSVSYWTSKEEEIRAWSCVAALLESAIPKLFQNGLYDVQYLMPMGIKVNNFIEDTMLLHHSIFPELQKGLGFLGSILTSEPAWKLMRKRAADTVKADE